MGKLLKTALAVTALGVFAQGQFVQGAAAQGEVNIYCSGQVEHCQAVANGFQKTTGIKVNMTQKSAGETLAQIRAESQRPRGDIWYGGTGDPHLVAAEDGLLASYSSPMNTKLHGWALKQHEASGGQSIGLYSGAAGLGWNTELLAKKGAPPPACWSDLIKPEYKGDIQISNPNSSGTAYVVIATLVQLMGEDQAFAFMKALHRNVNSYTRSGAGPIKAAARGETTVAVTFMHDVATEKSAGFPVAFNPPCEGTGYEIGSMSIIKGSRNFLNAQKFYDWALTPESQRLAYEAKQFQMQSNKDLPLPAAAPDLSKIKLVNYDFVKYGRSAERARLLKKWDQEIGSLPR